MKSTFQCAKSPIDGRLLGIWDCQQDLCWGCPLRSLTEQAQHCWAWARCDLLARAASTIYSLGLHLLARRSRQRYLGVGLASVASDGACQVKMNRTGLVLALFTFIVLTWVFSAMDVPQSPPWSGKSATFLYVVVCLPGEEPLVPALLRFYTKTSAQLLATDMAVAYTGSDCTSLSSACGSAGSVITAVGPASSLGDDDAETLRPAERDDFARMMALESVFPLASRRGKSHLLLLPTRYKVVGLEDFQTLEGEGVGIPAEADLVLQSVYEPRRPFRMGRQPCMVLGVSAERGSPILHTFRDIGNGDRLDERLFRLASFAPAVRLPTLFARPVDEDPADLVPPMRL